MSDLTTVSDPTPSRLTSAIRHGLSAAWVAAVPISVAMVGSADAQSGFPAEFDLADLTSADGFRLDGDPLNNGKDASVGTAIAPIGDIDGDGFDDFAIGVKEANGVSADGGAESYSGVIYVVFGSSNGLDGTEPFTLPSNPPTGFKISGEDSNDNAGHAVASAGDVNGDGVADFLVTAQGHDFDSKDDPGAAYVIFGSKERSDFPADLSLNDIANGDGTMGFKILGSNDFDKLGDSAALAGDFNGDGIDDLIIGSVFASPNGSYSGQAYVIFGSKTPFTSPLPVSSLNGTNGVIINGAAAGDNAGRSVSGAGDFNGDGIADVIIGAHYAGSADGSFDLGGRAYVVFGKSQEQQQADPFDGPIELSSLAATEGVVFSGDSYDFAGFSVAGAGDFNGDGIDDVIIGTSDMFIGTRDTGAYVVFGKSAQESTLTSPVVLSALTSTEGIGLIGAAADDYAGSSVSGAGDFNGDGLDDVIVGAADTDSNNRTDAGSAYVVFGRTTITTSFLDLSTLDGSDGFRIDGESAGDSLGAAVALGGDFNSDGVDDLLLGAPAGDGSTYMLLGGVTGFNEIPQADATPSLLNFPSTEVDQTTETQTITVANPGTGPLSIGTLSFTGTDASDFVLSGDTCSGQTVAINSDCTVDVAMTPTGTGTRSASLSIPSNALTSPEAVVLSGEAAQAGEAALSSSALDFGSVVVGGSGKPQVVTITNSGPGALTIGQVALSGADAADFVLSDDTCSNQTLAMNASCTVTVEVSPNASGSKTATLTIPSDGETQTVSLATQAFDPVPVPTLSPWWLTWMAGLFGLLGWLGLRRS